MNAATEVRRASALRLAERLAREPGLRAMLLLGSAAEGTCDDASDVDLALYWAVVPDRERLDALQAELGEGERFFFLGEPSDGGCVDSYRIGGIRHDFAHMTLGYWQAQTDDVLVALNVESLWPKALHGTLHGEVLAGAAVIDELRARLLPYPAALRLALLTRYCTFAPQHTIERQARERGDLLFYYDLLVKLQQHVLFTLCAVNGVYHAMEFKRLARFVERQLPLAPASLAMRLDSLLTADPTQPHPDLGPLVEETLDVVERCCPAFDVAPARVRWRMAGR